MERILQIDPKDNVLVALADLSPGEVMFGGETFLIKEPIAQKHKFFKEDIAEGGIITMYGVPVGKALKDLKLGELMSTANITHFANGDIKKLEGFKPSEEYLVKGDVRIGAPVYRLGKIICIGLNYSKYATICMKHQANPRDVYESHLEELHSLMHQPGSTRV